MMDNSTPHWTDDDELVTDFVLNRLPLLRHEELSLHLATCERCRESVKRETLFAARMKLAGRAGMKEWLKSRLARGKHQPIPFAGRIPSRGSVPWMKIAGIAAASIIIIVVGVYNNWFGSPFASRRSMTVEVTGEHPPVRGADSSLVQEEKSLSTREPHPATEQARPEEHQEKPPQPPLAMKGRGEVMSKQESPNGEQPPPTVAERSEPETPAAVPVPTEKKGLQLTDNMANTPTRTYWVKGHVLSEPSLPYSATRAFRGTATEGLSKSLDTRTKVKRDRHAVGAELASNVLYPISLKQMPASVLPSSTGIPRGLSQTTPTMIESIGNGIQVTFFLDHPVPDSVLDAAEITRIDTDSLLVRFSNHVIGLKLPPDLSEGKFENKEVK